MTAFTYETDIDVRLRDIDFMGHVNNAVYASYLEQARGNYFRDVLDVSLAEVETVLASLEIEYVLSIEIDHDVTVALAVSELGTSSLTMEYEIRADGECAATARTVQVMVDRESGTSKPIPSAWRERISTTDR